MHFLYNSEKKAKVEAIKPFDVAEYLDSPEVIAEYLCQILEDGDIEELIEALFEIAAAEKLAKKEAD